MKETESAHGFHRRVDARDDDTVVDAGPDVHDSFAEAAAGSVTGLETKIFVAETTPVWIRK